MSVSSCWRRWRVVLAGGGLAYAGVPSFHRGLNQESSGITGDIRRSFHPT